MLVRVAVQSPLVAGEKARDHISEVSRAHWLCGDGTTFAVRSQKSVELENMEGVECASEGTCFVLRGTPLHQDPCPHMNTLQRTCEIFLSCRVPVTFK